MIHPRCLRPEAKRVLLRCLLLFACQLPLPFFNCSAQVDIIHQVLVVYDSGDRLAPIADFDGAFKIAIQGGKGQVAIFREFLNTGTTANYRVNDPEFEKKLRRWMLEKYGAEHIELVVAFGRIPSSLLPGVPTIYVEQPKELGGGKDGVAVPMLSGDEFSRTVEIALVRQPNARKIVLVSGASPADRLFNQIARAQLAADKDRFQIVDLTGMSAPKIKEELAHLSSDSIAILLSVRQDGDGKVFDPHILNTVLAAASSVPVYATVRNQIDVGVVGGYMMDFSALGEQTGKIGLQILNGTDPKSIQVQHGLGHGYFFDERQLKRWGIDARKLPRGSQILFHEEPLWEQYKWWIVAVLLLLVGQLALIIGLLFHRRRASIAQEHLQRRLDFEALLSELSVSLLQPNGASDAAIANGLSRVREFLGFEAASLFARESSDVCKLIAYSSQTERVPVESKFSSPPYLTTGIQLKAPVYFHDADRLPKEIEEMQDCIRAKRLLSGAVVPLRAAEERLGYLCFGSNQRRQNWSEDEKGKISFLAAFYTSVLEWRRREFAMAEVSGRLLEAQEQERTRIARELHDDLSQRLALLAMQSEQAEKKLGVPEEEVRQILRRIFDQAVDLSADVRRISHQLHSMSLEHLGLVPALRQLCQEFSVNSPLEVEFHAPAPEPEFTESAAQCLFRVAQESLRNIVKYSGSGRAWVKLRIESDRVVLEIHDNGKGFDPAKALGGLGLVSMRERTRLEGGSFTINAAPGEGAQVIATLPLKSLQPMKPALI